MIQKKTVKALDIAVFITSRAVVKPVTTEEIATGLSLSSSYTESILKELREAVGRGQDERVHFVWGPETGRLVPTAELPLAATLAAMEAGALDYLVKSEITPRALERSLRYAMKLGDTLEALRRLATRASKRACVRGGVGRRRRSRASRCSRAPARRE